MRAALIFAVLLLSCFPAMAHADDIAPLYPDATESVWSIDIKSSLASPALKEMIGQDKPADVQRKLWCALFGADLFAYVNRDAFPMAVFNGLDRLSHAGAYFLEGKFDVEELAKDWRAAAGFRGVFKTQKIGERTLLSLHVPAVKRRFFGDSPEVRKYGIRVSECLFVVADNREVIDEILDKHAGKRQSKLQPALAEVLKRAKATGAPIWVVSASKESGIDLLTVVLQKDVTIRFEYRATNENQTKELQDNIAKALTDPKENPQTDTPVTKFLKTAGIVVKRDGKLLIVTGTIPAKLLAEEYAKQK